MSPKPQLEVDDPEAFTRDWNTEGMTLAEIGALHGCAPSTVPIVAHRLGLKPRRGHSIALEGGEWVLNDRGIKVWQDSA